MSFKAPHLINVQDVIIIVSLKSKRIIMKHLIFIALVFSIASSFFANSEEKWRLYNEEVLELVPKVTVWRSYVDVNNIKWLGTTIYGLLKFDDENWTILDTSNSDLKSNIIKFVTGDKYNSLWLATTHDGAIEIKNNVWRFYNKENSGIGSNLVNSIEFDRQSNIWFGTNFGMYKFDGNEWIGYTDLNSGLLDYSIKSIAVDSNNNIWYGTSNYGFGKFDGEEFTNYTPDNSDIPYGWAHDLKIDSKNRIWMISQKFSPTGVIACYDGENINSYSNEYFGIENATPLSIALDSSDNVWIGYYNGGLIKFDGTDFKRYDSSNSGLPGNSVRGLCFDKLGNLWMSVNDIGIVVFNETGIKTSVEDNFFNYKLEVEVFPNPAIDKINIKTNTNLYGCQILAYNVLGQLVLSEFYPTISRNNTISLDLKNISAPGTYLLRLKTDRESTSKLFQVLK